MLRAKAVEGNKHPTFGCGIRFRDWRDVPGTNRVYSLPEESRPMGEVRSGTVFCGRIWVDKTEIMLCDACAVKHGFLW